MLGTPETLGCPWGHQGPWGAHGCWGHQGPWGAHGDTGDLGVTMGAGDTRDLGVVMGTPGTLGCPWMLGTPETLGWPWGHQGPWGAHGCWGHQGPRGAHGDTGDLGMPMGAGDNGDFGVPMDAGDTSDLGVPMGTPGGKNGLRPGQRGPNWVKEVQTGTDRSKLGQRCPNRVPASSARSPPQHSAGGCVPPRGLPRGPPQPWAKRWGGCGTEGTRGPIPGDGPAQPSRELGLLSPWSCSHRPDRPLAPTALSSCSP